MDNNLNNEEFGLGHTQNKKKIFSVALELSHFGNREALQIRRLLTRLFFLALELKDFILLSVSHKQHA